MKLERDEWAKVLRLLDQALDLPAAERLSWLDTLVFDPPHLRMALRRLLEDRRAVETADFLGAGARWTASSRMAGRTTFILAGWAGMNVAG